MRGAAIGCRGELARRLLMTGLTSLTLAGCWQAPLRAAPSFAAVVPARDPAEPFNYDRFGTINVYRSHGHPRDVVLLVSGGAGWDARAASLAQRLADKGAMVVGIDVRTYRDALEKAGEACVSPASDFENLSHYVQSKLALKKYFPPILVGYGTGANLVYATLREAPEGLFKGALSVGFCADTSLRKPVCEGPDKIAGKWIALQGAMDTSCPVAAVQKFARTVPGSEVVVLPRMTGNLSTDESWLPKFDAEYARLAATRLEAKAAVLPGAVADLPLTIVPAAPGGSSDWFGVFLTGDGGWVGLDKGVSIELAKHHIPIVGWDSLKYFWSRRTPDGASHDLDRVLRYYAHAWGKSHVLLIGYSQGADTMPFMVNRLPPATHDMVGFTTLLGISDNALWEFHVATWLGSPAKGIPTAPELARWSGSPYLCLYGESDGDAACADITGHDGTSLKVSGGHHFGGNYAHIADEILSRLPTSPSHAATPSTASDGR
jgi:type IV secretory pathway VirJ component